MESLFKEILKFGLLPTFLLIIIFLIIQNPDRALKVKALITQPFFKFLKWFSKEYISSKVTGHVNEFFKRSIYSFLVESDQYKFKVKWVTKTDDPILTEDGRIILRLKEENDQTRNIISAIQVALPHVICPFVRNNISQSSIKAIDLTIMQKLAYQLGRHGKATYKKFFLDPETSLDKTIGDLIRKLFKLDRHGFFVPIFLNELELIGEGIYAENDLTDYTEQTFEFINYLLSIVNRERGSEIELNYLTKPFKIGTILLAKPQKADKQGLRPYLKRLRIKLDKGCESIYFVAYPLAFDFFDKLIETLDGHERVFVKKVFHTSEYELEDNSSVTKLRIALLRKNDIYVDEDFQKRLEANNISVGKKVEGIVEHVSKNETLVNVLGMRAYIDKKDCSWISISECSKVLHEDQELVFEVKDIDKTTSTIQLTLKFDHDNPWLLDELPRLNEIIKVKIIAKDNLKYTCVYDSRLEIYVPIDEISWFLLSENSRKKFINTTVNIKVKEVDEDNQKIFGSLRQTEENPWPIIHKSLPKGKGFSGKVVDVTHYFVDVELPNGYRGRLPKEALERAGYEYKNFQDNIVLGQGIEVVISKVFINKQRIRLDLKRNIKNNAD